MDQGPTPLALFDLDHTLLEGDSETMWSRFLFEQRLVGRDFLSRITDFYNDYQKGNLDIHAYEAVLLRPLTEHPIEELHELRQRYLREVQLVIRPFMLRRVRKLRECGYTLVLITATNCFLAEPIGEMLEFSRIICTQIKVHAGSFTTSIRGTPAFGMGKIELLERWMKKRSLTFQDSWGFSDSHNDLPLLSRVEHPVAVRPDPILQEHARLQGWEILNN